MKYWRIYFGHINSIGVEVEGINERGARVRAMDILRENRGETRWNANQCVYWEDGLSFSAPTFTKGFGAFPPIVKVELLG